MKTNLDRNAETLRQIFSADKLDTSVLDHVLDTDTLLKIAKDGNDSLNKNNETRAHTDVSSYPDPNGKTINSYVCEITIAPIFNEDGLSMSWFENSLEDINKDLLSLGLQEVKDLGKIYTVHKRGIDINIFVKYITGEYDKRYESYSIPEIKSKFEEKLEEAIKKSKAKTGSYRRNNMKKTITSANENSYVYMIGVAPEDWTKQDAIACIKNHVTNYGYYKLGEFEGSCLVGRYEDIVNLVENYFGVQVDDTMMCQYDDFDWDDAIKMDRAVYNKDEIESSRKSNKRRPIKSGRFIKSGTSNYWNGNATSYDFPLVIYEAENYVYDEETDTETEERDYDADQWEYEDAIANAETLADKFDVELGEHTYKPYTVQIKDGYYAGLQIIIDDTEYDGILIAEDDEEYAQLTEDYPNDYVYTREEFDNMCKEYGDKIMAWLKELVTNYGWQAINVVGHFSNGEGVYERSNVFNSRKPVKSSFYVRCCDQNDNDVGYVSADKKVTEDESKIKYFDTEEDAKDFAKQMYDVYKEDNEVHGLGYEFYVDEEITSSRKSIKSGMSYQDALVGFTSMGKPWGDYWEMQQDWAAYVDSLERDGEVDYEEAKNWDNPCTPQTFKEWINE